ncbi:lipopolysaccharide transport periplasmic protein LptA [Marinobacter sp. OP 3.4]|uniref:lipopolysaccharide transport periplasmic protein LptA n=1 Tax=Marinobacter sp. OP 3.4 TaxID=3076501 RepID=UPI002E1BC970
MKPVSNLAGRLLLLSTLVLGPALPALAFNLESNEPIRVTADSARLDDNQGIAIYRGNVEVRQGGILLTADRVDVHRNAQGLDRIDARGQPATYSRPATETEGPVDAEALLIHYSAPDNLLRFEREAVVKQGGDEFRGAVINYNTVNRVVTGEGLTAEGEGSGRVEMVIQPRGNNTGGNSGNNN